MKLEVGFYSYDKDNNIYQITGIWKTGKLFKIYRDIMHTYKLNRVEKDIMKAKNS